MLHIRRVHALRSYLAEDRIGSPYSILEVKHDHRVIPLSRSRHVRGWHPVRPGHDAIGFESQLERRVIDALTGYSELIRVASQPVTVTYHEDGMARSYTPDFMVHLHSVPFALAELGFGDRTYVEVKPYFEAMKIRDRLSRRFAALAEATGRPVVLITDLDSLVIDRGVRHGA